jgi:hypothetical protein
MVDSLNEVNEFFSPTLSVENMAGRFIVRERLNAEDMWRKISPEEKLELLAKAHAKGCSSVVLVSLVGATVSLSIKVPAIFWVSLLVSPLVFQFSCQRSWRSIRPTVLLQYLAARSAARRFAFTLNGRDLTCRLMFRGYLHLESRLHDDVYANTTTVVKKLPVWIALFGDAIVVMSESPQGAELKVSRLIDERMIVEGISPPNEKEYSSGRQVKISYKESRGTLIKQHTISSEYPAALIVFEKKLLEIISEIKREAERARAVQEAKDQESSGSFF